MKRLYQTTRRAERCELCAKLLASDHDHLFDPNARQLVCACNACVLVVGDRFRRVPDVRERVAIDPRGWLPRLGVPVGVAAVILHDDGRAVAAYPGPAGLVESELERSAWHELQVALAPPSRGEDATSPGPALVPEVEAIVLSTLAPTGAWRVGIDVVFELVGALREKWRGMTGGPDAFAALADVLSALEPRAKRNTTPGRRIGEERSV